VKIPLPHFLERLKTERRQYFDEAVNAELWDLLEASALLDVKEFTVFELAYKDWFGRHPQTELIENYFSRYMFNGAIPVWVRRYSRMVVELDQRGELNPRQLGVYKRLPSRRLVLIGRLYVSALLLILVTMAFFAYRPEARQVLAYERDAASAPSQRYQIPLP